MRGGPTTAQASAIQWPLILSSLLVLALAYRLALAHAAASGSSRSRLRGMGEGGNRRAAYLAQLLGQRDAVHGALHMAFDASIVLLACCLWWLIPRGGPLPRSAAAPLLALLLPLVAELVPRVIASRRSEATAVRHVRWIAVWYRLLGPLARLVLREPAREEADEEATEDSIRELVDSTPLRDSRRRRIAEILEFPEKQAGDVMVPRIDMVGVNAGSTLSEAAAVLTASGHGRVPVFGESRDAIVGILHANDLVRALPGDAPVESICRPASYVPEGIGLDHLLRELRARQRSMAIVRDEYGGTAGLVTVEDVIEEIVGDIADETDREEEPPLRPRPEGGYVVAARMETDELADALGLALPEHDEAQTVGGLAMSLAEDLPREGEVVVWEDADARLLLLVTNCEGPRVVELTALTQTADTGRGEEAPAEVSNVAEGSEVIVPGKVSLAALATALLDESPPATTATLADLFAFWPAGERAGRRVYWRVWRLAAVAEDADGGLSVLVEPEA